MEKGQPTSIGLTGSLIAAIVGTVSPTCYLLLFILIIFLSSNVSVYF